MFFRTRTNNSFEQEYQDLQEIEVDLKHMNSIDLTDSEIEFLQMKRARNKHATAYTPDPRLGEYEA
jgi:nicotinic acid phosphoribosyltransferase